MIKPLPITNGPTPDGKPWFSLKNEATAPAAEIYVYDRIGRSLWDDSGIGAQDFIAAVKSIPADRMIDIHVNCPGGSVWDGIAIHTYLATVSARVTTCIDSLAASTGGWAFLSAGKVQMAANGHLMMHDPSAPAPDDTAKGHIQAAEVLQRAKDTICNIFAAKSGKPAKEFAAMMDATTWLTADQTKALGLCDSVTAACDIQNSFDLTGFTRVPEALLTNSRKTPALVAPGTVTKNTMEKIRNLLKKHGITVPDNATDEQLYNLLETLPVAARQTAPAADNSADITALRNEIKGLQTARDNEKRTRIKAALTVCANEARIPANDVEAWVGRCIQDETLLAVVQNMTPNKPGVDPLAPVAEITSESPSDIGNHIVKNLWSKGVDTVENVKARGIARASLIVKNLNKLVLAVQNTNTIPTELKRAVLLQQGIKDFALRLIQVRAFTSAVNAPLEGTDKIILPFYDLETAASVDFDEDDGYLMGNSTKDKREITINKRKYQSLSWSSKELRRQPYLNVLDMLQLKAAKLGVDVFTDLMSLVKAAKFATVAYTGAASTFDTNTMATLKLAAKTWPEAGRSLFVDSAYDANLLKDDTIKNSLYAANNNAQATGKVQPVLFGFNYNENPNIPANGENLTGFINFKSAILFGQAPIEPSEEVRNQLSRYEVVVDPESGVSLEYRAWGDPDADKAKEVIECNYGYDVGNAKALQRIRSAA